jgi:hypothetical protein
VVIGCLKIALQVRKLTDMKNAMTRLDLEAEIPPPDDDNMPIPDVEVSCP